MKRLPLLLLLPLWVALSVARAGQLDIQAPEHCSNLHIEVSNQPLSEVLQQLAGTLNFWLYFDPSADRQITLTLDDAPVDLLKQMLARDGYMLQERHDPVCGRPLPDALWVLGEGEYNADQAVRYTPPVDTTPEPERSAKEIEKLKKQGHRKYMTPEERYNERIQRRLEKRGATMVSGKSQAEDNK